MFDRLPYALHHSYQLQVIYTDRESAEVELGSVDGKKRCSHSAFHFS